VQSQIRLILEAEAAASRSLDAAREEAAALRRRAEEDSLRRVREAREARDAIARAAEEEVLHEASERAARQDTETRARVSAMQAKGEPRIEAAVQATIAALLPRSEDAR